MKKELRDKIIAHNIRVSQGDQAKKDIEIILAALSNGQRKQLAKNEIIAEIFVRRGIIY